MGSDYKEDVSRKYVIAYKSGAPLTHSMKMFLFLKWFVVLRKVKVKQSRYRPEVAQRVPES
jgi:hypothetical protein